MEVSHTVKKAIRAQHVQFDSTLSEKDVREAVKIERYSPEYFELIKNNPGIGKLLSVGPQVTFLWKGELISIVSIEK